MAFVDIFISCPVCTSQGYNTKREYWTHAGVCGGILCIDEEATVWCRHCRKNAPITQMRFNCPADRHTFEVPTSFGLSEAFSCSAQMVNANGNEWFISVLKYIE